jgi:hypothetical protein
MFTDEIDCHVPLTPISDWGLVHERNNPGIFVFIRQIKHAPDCQLGHSVNVLEVVIRLLKLVVEEQVVLRELEVSEVQFLNDIVSQYVGYDSQL